MMKKILFIACLFLFCGCDPFDENKQSVWAIVNNTDEDILIETSLASDKEMVIEVSAKGTLTGLQYRPNDAQSFNAFFIGYSNDAVSLYNTINIYSADKSRLLKTWYISEMNADGRQFFDEAYWVKTTYQEDKWDCTEWIFRILSEDIH